MTGNNASTAFNRSGSIFIGKGDAIALVKSQLDTASFKPGQRYHYGRVELAQLLTAIYGETVTVEQLQEGWHITNKHRMEEAGKRQQKNDGHERNIAQAKAEIAYCEATLRKD